jgi:outer membrane protein TolC
VQAARLGAEAAAADVRRANARWLPTVGAMVRTDWASPDRPFGGTPFWSAGLMVTVPVFSGGGEFADRERAHARAQAASARAAGAEDQAELEVTRYAVERDVALQRLRLADRALAQSTEALRLVQRRYDGGLAAITELLDAAAARSAADLAAVSARHDVLVAVAAERVARGLDLSPLYALDR